MKPLFSAEIQRLDFKKNVDFTFLSTELDASLIQPESRQINLGPTCKPSLASLRGIFILSLHTIL